MGKYKNHAISPYTQTITSNVMKQQRYNTQHMITMWW